MSIQPNPRQRRLLQFGALFASIGALALGSAAGAGPPQPKPALIAHPQAATASNRLTYNFKAGEQRRYKLSAFFTGHFPPIAEEGNDPANLEADIVYVMTVKKVEPAGAEVEFAVDSADINLLPNDPGPNKTIPEADKIPVPITQEQIQQALNVTARIQPNGTVASVSGGNNSPIKVDIGFDLRKMFLTMLPVVFPATAVHPGQPWSFDDGVLGHNPGGTTYTATLEKTTTGKANTLTVTQNGEAVINSKLDKEGNSTDKPADQVGSLTGKVTAEGRVLFAASKASAGSAVQATESRINLVALLKRTLPDPADPTKKVNTNIDVKARLVVKPDNAPKKAAATAKEKL